MNEDPTRNERRDVLALAMGVLGTAADRRDAGIAHDEAVELRAAREIIVERTTPPEGVQQNPAGAREAEAVLGIVDAALRGEHAVTGLSALTWAQREVQLRLAAIIMP